MEEFNSHKPLPHALTAIFKAPVAGAVAIEELNLAGDQQADLATASGTVFESAAQVQQHANSSSLALYAKLRTSRREIYCPIEWISLLAFSAMPPIRSSLRVNCLATSLA